MVYDANTTTEKQQNIHRERARREVERERKKKRE
jgi:hypothetical protein